MMTTTTNLDAALWYASVGWHVLPVQTNSKLPASAHGVHDATTDAETIRGWWAQNPHYNVAIAAGEISGIVVFDIDPRNGGREGWDEWIESVGDDLDGPVQLTAGGGEHRLATWQPGLRSCKLAQGVDFLSDGRYFVAFPSEINGRTYEWEGSSDPMEGVAVMPVPTRWLGAIGHKKRTQPARGGLITGNRNAGLTSLAGVMRHHGMTEAEILSALTVANEERCDIPLPDSEIRQIVRSVARYEPEHDIAANMAIGATIADTLLAPKQTEAGWLIQADEFSSEPAPVEWLVKGWVQANALIMVHGPSGSGKTFQVLDWVARIACGMSDWRGKRVRNGGVVYLAGEGHVGLRARLAGWKHHHQVKRIGNMWLSDSGCDLNTAAGYTKVIEHIRLLPEPPCVIVVDTLHRFLAGDENSAQDAKTMLDACAALMREFGCTVILVHHTGVSEEAQHRARGSSAWRGALDIEISVVPGTVIELIQRKSKDAELSEPINVKLESVQIPGWYDQDGEPVTTAVMVEADADAINIATKLTQHRVTFEEAWETNGREVKMNRPYLKREYLVDYLVKKKDIKESSAKVYVKPNSKGRIICELISNNIVEEYDSGWIVVDPMHGSAMMLLRNRTEQ